ncbi:protein LEAD-SENSITIVE 1 [Argentina anserina]|uniref:protein LEAD-SENSITIVE 1 n=1 Tax=Argentina anserina TaxID=57926 RepID=UPI0021762366|nr:protein LEAD-SENSITIVE 1 [Potentilla anserina]
MGLLSNRVAKGSLKPGDHIYSWRTAYIYAHHGIYIGDDKVIHFTRRGQEVGTGTVLDLLLVSSGPAQPRQPCEVCTPRDENCGVLCSCLNCFLAGGVLYRFEYSVNPALFLAKARGGTCTLAVSDSDDIVVHRAKYLLEHGFGCYCIFKNNCEDFAIYCKTGLLVMDQRTLGQSGQAASIIGGPLAAVLATPLRLVTTNLYGMVAVGIGVYCASRYSADIGKRMDVVKVSVEDMTTRLAAGSLRVVETQISAPLLQAPESEIAASLIQVPESRISAAPTTGPSNLFFWSRSISNLVSR